MKKVFLILYPLDIDKKQLNNRAPEMLGLGSHQDE